MTYPLQSKHCSLSHDQIRVIKRLDPRASIHALIQLTMILGLRPKEALGLCWSTVHISGRCIRICKQLYNFKGTGQYELRPFTKTFRPRTLALGQDALRILLIVREQQEKDKSANPSGWSNPFRLVFTHHDGRPFTEEEVETELCHLMEEASLPHIRFYDLRHTAATAAQRELGDITAVQRMLGHTTPTVTEKYYVDRETRGKRTVAISVNAYTEGVLNHED